MPQWTRRAEIEQLVKLAKVMTTQHLPERFMLLSGGTPN
jgi:hypothetical protein